MLEEDFKEKVLYNDKAQKINVILCEIKNNNIKLDKKTLIDNISKVVSITSDIFSTIASLGSISQGLIPLVQNILFG